MTPQLLWFVDGLPSQVWIAAASAQAAVLIVAVLALRAALGRHLAPGWRLALWTIVLLRLVVPLAVESRWNLVSLARRFALTATHANLAAPLPAPRPAHAPRVSITYGPIPNALHDAAPAGPIVEAPSKAVDFVGDAWLAGFVALVLAQAVRAIGLRRAVRRMRPVEDASLLALADRCAKEVGVRRHVRLVETDRLRSPAVCGIVWPTILLPFNVIAALAPAELRLVLLHEFAHVRRNDALVAALARLVRAFHWFNPLVWVGVGAFSADGELACDAAVLHLIGDGERRTYGECLLHVVERVSGLPRHRATLGVFGSTRQLQRRIDAIATPPSRSPFARLTHAIASASIVVLVGAAAAVGEPHATTSAATTRPADAGEAGSTILSKPLPALRLKGLDLAAATDAIGKAGGVAINVDWPTLAAAGIPRTTRTAATSLTNVALSKVLDIVFADLKTPDGQAVTIDYEVIDDAVVVSTAADIAKRVGTATRTFALPAAAAGVDEQIVTLVTDTIDSLSWRRNGGTGEIAARDGQLTVMQTPRRLAAVARLMEQLTGTRGATPADKAASRQVGPDGRNPLIGTSATVQPTTSVSATAARTRATLDAPLGKPLHVAQMPFTRVVDQLRAMSGVDFFVNWTAVEGAGVSRGTPITFDLSADVPLGRAVSVLVDAAGGGRVKLGHTMDDGVVSITTRDDLPLDVMTRTYDIRDLLIPILDFNVNSTQPATTQPARADAVRQIIDIIQTTIDADSWRVNGGKIGSIQELGGQLIVTNTPAVQNEIETLLVQFRAGRALQVVVEARFIAADPASVPTLLGIGGPNPIALDPPGDASKVAGAFLDEAQAATLLRSLQLGEAASTLTAPKLTLFNGQSAFVRVETTHAYISTFTVSVPAAGERKYEPVIEQARTGVTLAVRATASADHRYVTLELDPRTSRLLRLETVPFAGDPASGLTVQRPNVEETSLATTLSLPSGGTVLLGGAHVAGGTRLFADAIGTTSAPATATQPSPRQLLLLVKANVIEPRSEP